MNVVYFQAGAETTSTTLLWWAFYLSISLTFGPRGELVGEKQDKKSTYLPARPLISLPIQFKGPTQANYQVCALPYPLPRSAGGRQGGGDLILTSGQILAGGQGDRGGEARDGAQAALLSGRYLNNQCLYKKPFVHRCLFVRRRWSRRCRGFPVSRLKPFHIGWDQNWQLYFNKKSSWL